MPPRYGRTSPAGYTSRTAKCFSPAQKKPAEAGFPLWESLLFLQIPIARALALLQKKDMSFFKRPRLFLREVDDFTNRLGVLTA